MEMEGTGVDKGSRYSFSVVLVLYLNKFISAFILHIGYFFNAGAFVSNSLCGKSSFAFISTISVFIRSECYILIIINYSEPGINICWLIATEMLLQNIRVLKSS